MMNAPAPMAAPEPMAPAPTAEEVYAAEETLATQQQMQIPPPPEPEESYRVGLLQQLVKHMNALFSTLAKQLPELEGVALALPEIKGDTWDDKIPMNLWGPLAGLRMALDQYLPEMAKKYDFDPQDITTNAALTQAIAQVKKMGGDAKLHQAMVASAAPPEASPAPPMDSAPPTPEEEDLLMSAV